MDNINWFITIFLSIPVGIITNLLTPYVLELLSKYFKALRYKNIAKLRAELIRLEDYVANKDKYHMDLVYDITRFLVILSVIFMISIFGMWLVAIQYVEPKGIVFGSELVKPDFEVFGIWGNRILLFDWFLYALFLTQFINQTVGNKIVVYRYIDEHITYIKQKIVASSKSDGS